jgi:hypothetical protein
MSSPNLRPLDPKSMIHDKLSQQQLTTQSPEIKQDNPDVYNRLWKYAHMQNLKAEEKKEFYKLMRSL